MKTKNVLFYAGMLVLSVVIWYISSLAQGIIEIFVLNHSIGSIFGESCRSTGYPFTGCVGETNRGDILYIFLNIVFWYVTIYLTRRFVFYKKSK